MPVDPVALAIEPPGAALMSGRVGTPRAPVELAVDEIAAPIETALDTAALVPPLHGRCVIAGILRQHGTAQEGNREAGGCNQTSLSHLKSP